LPLTQRAWPGLDHLCAIQAGGGVILGLIALFSSYDHITAFGRSIGLQQQWGVFFIVASLATVFTDSCHTARHLGATLNWRPVREIESETEQIKKETEQL
jgi:hypothetical protein